MPAWLLLLLLSVSIIAYSISISWDGANLWFGTNPADLDRKALGVAAADIVKALLLLLIAGLWTQRQRALSLGLAIVLVGTTVLSVQATYSAFTAGRSEVIGEKEAEKEKLADLRDERARLVQELETYKGLPSARALREQHRAMEFDRRWDTSEGCTNATALGSRRFCAKRAEIFSQITGATKAEQIRERIDTLSQEIRKQTTTETATATAPDLQRISDITGLDTQGVIGLRSLIVAIALDLLAAIMVVATSHSFLSSNMKAEQRSLQDRPPKPHERKEGRQE